MIDYIAHRIKRVGRDATADIRLLVTTSLPDALNQADIIVSQIRVGGMAARAQDEQMALEVGIPGDEGVGPSGLAAYLRGREFYRSRW